MRRRICLPLAGAVALILMMALTLSGCGEKPLEKAYQQLSSGETPLESCTLDYDPDRDVLEIGTYGSCDLDKLFAALEENIAEQEIGGIIFKSEGVVNDYHYHLDNNLLDTYGAKIAALPCTSMGLLGVDTELVEMGDGAWTAAAAKAEKVWMPASWMRFDYKGDAAEGLKNIKKLWVSQASIGGVSNFPNLEELAICTDLEVHVSNAESSEQESEAPQNESKALIDTLDETAAGSDAAVSEEAAVDAAESDADAEAAGSDADGSDADSEAAEVPAYEFDYEFRDDVSGFRGLKDAKNLQRLLIAPDAGSYTLTPGGCGFFYALCNTRPDLLVNPPDKPFSEDDLVRADTIDISKINEQENLKESILLSFLNGEVESCYKKAAKFKKKSKDPTLNGNCLVYIVDPYQYSESDWASKREYNSDGKIIMSELDGDIPIPTMSGDYDTFIYGYPTFSKVGNYTSGTKAYSQTYYVQVFDLKEKTAYETQTVGTEQPPQQFSYSGTAPDKKSGVVEEEKIIKFIKKLK